MNGADYNALEAKQAKRDGAELVKNSGRGQRKGDARRGDLLIDYKFTEKGSYSINLKSLKEFEKQAMHEGYRYVPVVVACFTEHNRQLAIVDWEELKAWSDELERLEQLLDDATQEEWK